MVITDIHNVDRSEIKKNLRLTTDCPICGDKLRIGIEQGYLKTVVQYPFPHIVLHGDPIHAFVVFIDTQLKIRGKEPIESIEIVRDGKTFGALIKKWRNPF